MFSVVIPFFNRGYCLGRCLESALDLLKVDSDLEVVLVDDGSDDNWFEAVSFFLDEDVELIVVSLLSNCGVTHAKNFGAAIASGEWIVFLDSDDLLIPGSCDVLYDSLEQSNSSINFFSCIDYLTRKPLDNTTDCQLISPACYLNGMSGAEKLPVIKRELFQTLSYPGELRGFEGLMYLEALDRGYTISVFSVCVRLYDCRDVHRRLSDSRLMKSRARYLSIGFWKVCLLIGFRYGFKAWIINFLKSIYYFSYRYRWDRS